MAQTIKVKNLTQTVVKFTSIPVNEYFITVANYHLCYRLYENNNVLDVTANEMISVNDNDDCMTCSEVDIAVTKL